MTQDFDYFLLLSIAAVGLVFWLIVRTFKTGRKKNIAPKIDHTRPQRRIERVAARTAVKPQPEIEPQAPKPRRITGFYFKTETGTPFAWVRLSTIGAQPWGNRTIELSENLQRFTKRFLNAEDNESLLISLFTKLSPETALIAECFTENGQRVIVNQTLGLKAADFPTFELSSLNDLSDWLLTELKTHYHHYFFRCSASEQVFLLASEKHLRPTANDLSQNLSLSLAYLILADIVSEKDFYKRARLWNFYWSVIETKTFPYTETLNTFERVVISQTFVQTQKLPFLLIQTPKGWGKCYNALNY